ncbi:hypothetical protein V6N11_020096 [Hibiscus sabdariffa]|uniref:Uncharacterized protein n=1 Tax=Hibiscus sabdariffa TaxID=183260 RepID=A0ABR2P925_9ROSI
MFSREVSYLVLSELSMSYSLKSEGADEKRKLTDSPMGDMKRGCIRERPIMPATETTFVVPPISRPLETFDITRGSGLSNQVFCAPLVIAKEVELRRSNAKALEKEMANLSKLMRLDVRPQKLRKRWRRLTIRHRGKEILPLKMLQKLEKLMES